MVARIFKTYSAVSLRDTPEKIINFVSFFTHCKSNHNLLFYHKYGPCQFNLARDHIRCRRIRQSGKSRLFAAD